MKKKIQVIKPTQRHKKRYVKLKVFKPINKYTEKEIYYLFNNNFCFVHGIILTNLANIYLVEYNNKQNTLLFRVNKEYLEHFLGSLLFIKELGVISVVSVNNTLESINSKP